MAEDNISIAFLQRELERVRAQSREDLKHGGGGGTFDGMEARVKSLEEGVKDIKGDLKLLLRDVAEIKGKISNLPSTWQMIGVFGGLVGLLLAGSGVLFFIIKYLEAKT